jgi:hypothetical protein
MHIMGRRWSPWFCGVGGYPGSGAFRGLCLRNNRKTHEFTDFDAIQEIS